MAVLRRASLVAGLAAAVLLLARAALGGPPWWIALGLSALAFAAVVAATSRRTSAGSVPSAGTAPAEVRHDLAPTARLLDRRLGLAETLGTAWELAPSSPADGTLAGRVLADGGRLVWSTRARTRAAALPARGEWAALAGVAGAIAALAAIGPSGGDGSRGAAGVRADAGASADSAREQERDGARVPTTSTAQAPPTSTTAPVPGARRGTSGAVGQPGARGPADGRDGAGVPRIAVRRSPADAGGRPGASAGGRSAGGATTPTGGGGQTGAGGRRGARSRESIAGAAPPAASLPTPEQVKPFSAEGRRATAPLGGAPAPARQGAGPADRSGARSGTRGAGSQTGRRGEAVRGSATTGDRGLALRVLATAGGERRGSGAGRATLDARGRGAARVESGSAATADGAASGPVELPFVPSAVNTVAPYLRALVASYFP